VTILLEAQMRVLVLSGWRDQTATADELAALPLVRAFPGRVLVGDEAPHDFVFAHAYFAVHHGGAGTTARALACGIPSIIVPVLRWADQSLYGELVERLGVGVLVRAERPTPDDLRGAVERVLAGDASVAHHTGSAMCARANLVGAQARAERAADVALALVESCLCRAVLTDKEAAAIRPRLPLMGSAAAGPRALPDWAALSDAQRMCVQHCVVCRRVRAEACVVAAQAGSDKENFRSAIPSEVVSLMRKRRGSSL
jgi:hypothetical protein